MKLMITILVLLFSFADCTFPKFFSLIGKEHSSNSGPTSCYTGTTNTSKIYTDCGSLCPPTCAKPNPGICAAVCVEGCFCPRGTFENAAGKCVKRCSKSKVFTECGSLCPPTCANHNPGPCAAVCVRGCFCPKGTFENAAGECVEQCSSNEPAPHDGYIPKVYNECGSACPPTCANPNPTCTLQCVEGCFCPKGTFENAAGECVKQCSKSKVYNECGSACPPTCANPKPEACAAVCVKGCFCPKGTFENSYGECVEQCSSSGPISSSSGSSSSSSASSSASSASSSASSGSSSSSSGPASTMCPDSKVYNECGSACPPTCANPNPEACSTECVKGCFCPKGTFQDASGQCVEHCSSSGPSFLNDGSSSSSSGSSSSSSASSSASSGSSSSSSGPASTMCPDSKVYNECGSACPPTCNPKPEACSTECVKGCFCPEGTFQDAFGKCVKNC